MSEDLNSPAGIAQGWATAAVSIVNGFFGDYLSVRQNGLAIDMAFYQDRRPLPLSPASLLRVHPQPSARKPYAVLNRIPVVATPARAVEQVQLAITGGVYQAIHAVNRLAGSAATRILDRFEEP